MMIVVEVLGQEPPQMALVQNDHVVQAVAADTSDEPFDVWGSCSGTVRLMSWVFSKLI